MPSYKKDLLLEHIQSVEITECWQVSSITTKGDVTIVGTAGSPLADFPGYFQGNVSKSHVLDTERI